MYIVESMNVNESRWQRWTIKYDRLEKAIAAVTGNVQRAGGALKYRYKVSELNGKTKTVMWVLEPRD